MIAFRLNFSAVCADKKERRLVVVEDLAEAKERMDGMVFQAIMWVGAGAVLFLYLKRRRTRKINS